ncbi:DMT family transporter [Vallitalea okinawensis]|uniref:DMT family transporter n=1 Tax=Vallitalea okinawensis TaxID=2078660 RepID=UPI001478B209|nr:DMT family transporter [Vallitalea okinawensis]
MKNNQNRRSVILSDVSLIIVAIIWGTGFIATQMAIDAKMSSSLIMVMRFFIASIVLYSFYNKKIKKITKLELKNGFIAGAFLFLAFFSQTLGLVYTTPSNNAFLTATNVIMVPFISWKMTSRKPSSKMFIAAFLCLIGISFLTYSFENGLVFNIGDLLTIICAFLFACHISYLGYCSSTMNTEKLTFIQMATATVMSMVIFMLFDFNTIKVANFQEGILPIIYLGLFSTCIAFFIQVAAQKKTSSTKAAVILSTEALFGSLFSIFLGFEDLTINLIIGGIILLTSILILEIKAKVGDSA